MWNDGDRLIAVIIFSASIFGAGIEDYRDGGFDCICLFQTADERTENVGALPDYRIHRPLVDD